MLVAVVDGLGGGIGKHIVEKVRKQLGENIDIAALGTNSTATTAMLKAGADFGATGKNAIAWNCRKADVILGSMGILLPNSMHGEISPDIAAAIGCSPGCKILIPVNRCGAIVAGVGDQSLPTLIDSAVEQLANLLD